MHSRLDFLLKQHHESLADFKAALAKFINEQKNLFHETNKTYLALAAFEEDLLNNHSLIYACKAFLAVKDNSPFAKNSDVRILLQTISDQLDPSKGREKNTNLPELLQEDHNIAAKNAQNRIDKFANQSFGFTAEEINSAAIRKKIAALINEYIQVFQAQAELGQIDPTHFVYIPKLKQHAQDILSGKCPLDDMHRVVIPGKQDSKETVLMREILDTFYLNALKTDKTAFNHLLHAEKHHAELIQTVDYFAKDRLKNPTIPEGKEANQFWAATESLLAFLIQYKKYKREKNGKHFNCYLFNVSAALSQNAIDKIKAEADNAGKAKEEIQNGNKVHENGIAKIEDFIANRITELAKKGFPYDDRFQIIINNGSHCTAVDVLLSNKDGHIQKKCFILDAAQEMRALEATSIFNKFNFEIYTAGKPGEKIQNDSTSCPIFAMVLLGKSSNDPDLFAHLDTGFESRPAKVSESKTLEHTIPWQALPASYIKYAQSDIFLSRYTETMSSKEKIAPVNKKGDTLEKYRKYQARQIKYSVPVFGGLFQREESKTQNIAATNKMLAYAKDAYEVVHGNSAVALWNVSQGISDPTFKTAEEIIQAQTPLTLSSKPLKK